MFKICFEFWLFGIRICFDQFYKIRRYSNFAAIGPKRSQSMEIKRSEEDLQGSVMVVGSGIAGMQAALDAANSGFLVYLVEKSAAIGGVMAQLDKTFPTNDCSM
jgi:heterodisulfide reductase subunit A